MIRSTDYQNPLNLYIHDAKVSDNFILEQWVALAYSDQGDYTNSLIHLSKSASMFPNEITYSLMGVDYEKLNSMDNAQEIFLKAVNTPTYLNDGHKHRLIDYEQLGDLLVTKNHNKDTKAFLINALKDYPDDPHLWYLLAITEYYLGDKKNALISAEKSIVFDPTNIQIKTLIYRLQNNLPLQFKFN